MIRPAKKEDYKQAIRLIYDTIGKIANTLAGTNDDKETTRVLESFFQKEGNRLSYQNTIVKEVDGQIVGILVSYHGSQTDEMDRPFVDRLIALTGNHLLTIEKEAQDDEYYLDTIAVDARYQRRGIGTELMHAFENKVVGRENNKLALLVERNNKRAYGLYKKMGYNVDGSVSISGYDFCHMIKNIRVLQETR